MNDIGAIVQTICVVVMAGIVTATVLKRRTTPVSQEITPVYYAIGSKNGAALMVPKSAADCHHAWTLMDRAVLELPHEKKYVSVVSCSLCGYLEKTVEVTSPPPPAPPLPTPACHHDWDLVEKSRIGGAVGENKLCVVLKCLKCGDIDKTIERVTIPAPPPPPAPPTPPVPRSECRHKWTVEKSVTLDSAYEQMRKNNHRKTGTSIKASHGEKGELDLDKAPRWMFHKTYIRERLCTLCGEIDKTIASNAADEASEAE